MKKILCLLAVALTFLVSSCMNVDCQVTESFEPTSDIQKFDKANLVPYQYKVIGTCNTSGNYQDFSMDSMIKKMLICGEEHGADAIIITAMRVMPHGRLVDNSGFATSYEATSSGSTNSWGEIDRDFNGKYGSIRDKHRGTAINYDRFMSCELIKYELNEQGDFIKNSQFKAQKKSKINRNKEENAKSN